MNHNDWSFVWFLVFFWLFVDIPGDYQADYLGNFPLNFPFYANYPNAIAVPGSLEGRSLARAIQVFPIELKTVNWG